MGTEDDLRARIAELEYMIEELTTPPAWLEKRTEGMTPQQSRILGRLMKSEGTHVCRDALLAAMYANRMDPADWPEDTDGVLKAQVSKLRKKVATSGIVIPREQGRGNTGLGYTAFRVDGI